MRFAACLILLAFLLGCDVRAGISDFTDRGKIDFDTAIQLLNPYGTWAKQGNLWAFTPASHKPPYSSGRWLYTEYGWYWQGTDPASWATEHYGYWKRGADKIWRWFPGSTWLPQIVEMRTTDTHVGWRSAEVDSNGNFVEEPADRFAKVDEWTFVTRMQFTRPITPAVLARPDVVSKLLDDSSGAMHTYVTYRAITRPGPHPADFLALNPRGGMFPPSVGQQAASVDPRAVGVSSGAQVEAAAGSTTTSGTNGPAHAASGTMLDDNGAPADMRQVPYWDTMSLPTYWTAAPARAQPNQIYIFDPELFQDEDGIERRITLWFNPATRTSLGDLRDSLAGHAKPAGGSTATGPGAPAVPVVPDAPSKNAFKNPFDESFHGDSKNGPAPNASTKAKPPAPSGLVAPPTNAAPDSLRELALLTYLRFHLVFNLPLLVILGALGGWQPWTRGELAAFGLVLLAVMLFTTPWDNLAVKWGIWGFPPGKYLARIGYLPVEEYAFFLLQSVNVMLAIRVVLHFFPEWQSGLETEISPLTLVLLKVSAVPWIIVAGGLYWIHRKAGPRTNYALHLAWFLPVIYTQWVIGPPLFLAHAVLLAGLTAVFGIYYTIADVIAVRAGIWFFDEKQITGVKFRGVLPWEEIAFFFLTSLLVAQSYLLLLPSDLR